MVRGRARCPRTRPRSYQGVRCMKDGRPLLSDFVFRNEREPLGTGSAAVYRANPGIERLHATGAPYHVAVHQVGPSAMRMDYCRPHAHPNCDELNVLVGEPGALTMTVTIGD